MLRWLGLIIGLCVGLQFGYWAVKSVCALAGWMTAPKMDGLDIGVVCLLAAAFIIKQSIEVFFEID